MRILFLVVIVVIVGYALYLFGAHAENIAIESSGQSAAVQEAVTAISGDFNETGTLVFYPNNVGPVPYLFYQDRIGHTVSKALVFPTGPPINFSSWSGAHISVEGYTDQEHVVVNDIAYLSPP